MVRRVDWWTTGDSSKEQIEQSAKTRQFSALETLAVKAFGDMEQMARLRLIRDRFIAGHSNCDLCRHLDSVSPETPIRDVVDRCRAWESHADPAVRRIGKPNPDPTYPTYAVGDSDSDNENNNGGSGHRTEIRAESSGGLAKAGNFDRGASDSEAGGVRHRKLMQKLVRETQSRPPAVIGPPVPTTLEQMLRSFLDGQRQGQRPTPRQ